MTTTLEIKNLYLAHYRVSMAHTIKKLWVIYGVPSTSENRIIFLQADIARMERYKFGLVKSGTPCCSFVSKIRH